MMPWETIATWIMLLITVGGFVFAMGKQAQKINDQQNQLDALKEDVKAGKELPIKLAALETDIKYLIREISEVKQLLIKDVGVR